MFCETQTQYGQFSFLPMLGVILRPVGAYKWRLALGWGFWRISFGLRKRTVDDDGERQARE